MKSPPNQCHLCARLRPDQTSEEWIVDCRQKWQICPDCLRDEKALPGDRSKQKYGLGGPIEVFRDQTRFCGMCASDYLFSAKEQQFWYETLGFSLQSAPPLGLCPGFDGVLRMRARKSTYVRDLALLIGLTAVVASSTDSAASADPATRVRREVYRSLVMKASKCKSAVQLRAALVHVQAKIPGADSFAMQQAIVAMDETLEVYKAVEDDNDGLASFHPIFLRNPGLLRETISLGGEYVSRGDRRYQSDPHRFYRARIVILALHNRAVQTSLPLFEPGKAVIAGMVRPCAKFRMVGAVAVEREAVTARQDLPVPSPLGGRKPISA